MIFLYFIWIGGATGVSFPSDFNNYKDIASFAHVFFRKSVCVTFICENEDLCENMIRPSDGYSVKIYSLDCKCQPSGDTREDYVITSDSLENITSKFQEIQTFDVSIRILIITTYPNHEDIFNIAANVSIYKLVIVFLANELKVVLRHPISKVAKVFNLTQGNDVEDFLKFKNYHGHLLRVSMFESIPASIALNNDFVGIDPMFAKTFAAKLNFSVVYIKPDVGYSYGAKLPNGTITGALGSLHARKIDFIFNQIFVKQYNISEFTFTSVIGSDRLCVVVPKSGKVPTWTEMFSCFKIEVWCLNLIALITTAILLYFTRKYKSLLQTSWTNNNKHQFDRRIQTAFLDTIQLFYNTCPPYVFSKNYYERLFIGAICLFTLVSNTSFQGSLATVLTTPKYYPDVNTLEQLADTGWSLSTSSASLLDTFYASDRPYMQKLHTKLQLIDNYAPSAVAYLTRESKSAYFKAAHGGRSTKAHMVAECPQSYLMAYMTRKDSLCLEYFNDLVRKIMASGLINKWRSDVMANASSRAMCKKQDFGNSMEPRPFSISDLQTSFYLLHIGLSISVLTFCLERRTYKNEKNIGTNRRTFL